MTHAASKDDLRVSTLFDFSSHVVLVTGGATGLGEMAAQAFVQNGAHVFIASRKESELRSTSTRLNELGPGKCDYIVADLKDKAGCLALCAELKKRTDRLTVLVNNSGASWGDDYYNYPEHAWDKLYALNVKSIFYMTVELEGLLAKGATAERPGRVINIASMAGITTVDVTTGEGGGLSKPGHGTFSCESYFYHLFLPLCWWWWWWRCRFTKNCRLTKLSSRRWTGQSGVHSSYQDAGFQTGAQEYHVQCHLPRCLSLANDKLWAGKVCGFSERGAAYG